MACRDRKPAPRWTLEYQGRNAWTRSTAAGWAWVEAAWSSSTAGRWTPSRQGTIWSEPTRSARESAGSGGWATVPGLVSTASPYGATPWLRVRSPVMEIELADGETPVEEVGAGIGLAEAPDPTTQADI